MPCTSVLLRRVLLAALSLPAIAAAQPSVPAIRSVVYASREIGTEAGLPQNSVNAMALGPDGALWLATYGGLARFDGRHVRLVSTGGADELSTPRIATVAPAPGGTLWVGTQSRGLGQVEGHVVRRVRLGAEAAAVDGATVSAILHDRRGDAWLGTNLGLLQRRADGRLRWWRSDTAAAVWRLLEDDDGAIWATGYDLLARVHGDSVQRIAIPGTAPGHPPAFLALAPDGRVLVATSRPGGEVLRWTGTGLAPVLRGFLAPDEQLRSLARLDSTTVAIGTSAGGVLLWAGDSLLRVQGQGLGAAAVLQVLARPTGGYWVATDVDGLIELTPPAVRGVAPGGERLPSANAVLVAPDGTRWASVACDLLEVPPGGALRWHRLGDCVRTLATDGDGRFWIGTDRGLFRWRPGTVLDGAPVIPGGISALTRGPDGRLWVGARRVHVLEDRADTLRSRAYDLDQPADVHVIHHDRQGRVLLGTGRGLWAIESADAAPARVAALGDIVVRGLHTDSLGALWVGTYGAGLWRGREGRFTRLSRADGLPEDIVSWVGEDAAGHLWLTGDRGMHRLSRAALHARADGIGAPVSAVTIARTPLGDRVEANGGVQPSVAWHPDGTLLMATIFGPMVVDPARVPGTSTAARVQIDEVLMDRVPAPVVSATLDVPPGTKRLEIGFSAIEFDQPDAMVYAYRLLPYDSSWVAGREGRAVYTALPPGAYTFEVRVLDDGGVASEAVARLAVTQQPRLTQTTGFRLAVAGLAVVLAFAAAWALSQAERRRALRLQAEVDRAIGELRILRGMLPICAWCKQVRDDNGAWTALEQYVLEHSEAEWTHGICEACESKVMAGASGPTPS
jgi:ligand-binding sensor domain-containing protein